MGKEKTLSPYWLTNCQLEDRTLAVIFIVNLYSMIYYKLNYTGLLAHQEFNKACV